MELSMPNDLADSDNIKDRVNKGDNAILKKLEQLHTWQTFMPHNTEEMSHDERKNALLYLMFLKEKEMDQSKHEDVQTDGLRGSKKTKKTQVHHQYQWKQLWYHSQIQTQKERN